MLVKSDKNYSVSDDITLEVTFEEIEKFRTLLESLKSSLSTLINLSFEVKSGPAGKRRDRVLQEQMVFNATLVIDESSAKSPKPILILVRGNVTESTEPGSTVSIKVSPKELKWINPSNSTDYLNFAEDF